MSQFMFLNNVCQKNRVHTCLIIRMFLIGTNFIKICMHSSIAIMFKKKSKTRLKSNLLCNCHKNVTASFLRLETNYATISSLE